MKGAKKKVLFQPSTGRVTRATTRGENHQPRSASAPRLGDSPERDPWELAQNQPGQVDTLSEENKAQITELQSPTSRRPEQMGLPSPPRTVPNPTDSFLRYQETPPLESVTQDMLNSQMHRL